MISTHKPDLRVRFCGIELRNPVIAASGTFGYGVEFEDIISLTKIGAFVTKGLSREPMAGNPPPRLIETSAGMLNAIGLQNMGVAAFIEHKLPAIQKLPCPGIANVFGGCIEDYCAVIRTLNAAEGIVAYELNASCPNTHSGGMIFGTNTAMLSELVAQAKSVARRPLIVKLSPNVTNIAAMARAAADTGADAISLVNTFLGISIDAKTRRPRLANGTGGVSGPAIKPMALRMVYEAANAVSIPVIGMGGITSTEDVIEFMLAGATAVQVGTASYADPRAVENIARGLKDWCQRHHVEKIASLTHGLEQFHGKVTQRG
ncbi:MAG TPA: dihydroorotate dehydrogenase [Acidobacteriaceae bacterium]|nr:dihydroorotate dehydrogenase [Acidobacteriaceae bacterium]